MRGMCHPWMTRLDDRVRPHGLRKECTRKLLRRNGCFYLRDTMGYTPAHHAAASGCDEVPCPLPASFSGRNLLKKCPPGTNRLSGSSCGSGLRSGKRLGGEEGASRLWSEPGGRGTSGRLSSSRSCFKVIGPLRARVVSPLEVRDDAKRPSLWHDTREDCRQMP